MREGVVNPPPPSPFIIPVFIAHQGCRHQCVFCNQHSITGTSVVGLPSPREVERTVRSWLERPRDRARAVQVAFYGGSFTGLAESDLAALLAVVSPFLENGEVQSIRCSTRPDYLSQEICGMLKRCGVRDVELGVQSLDDEVLARSGRGHTVAQVEEAFVLLRQAGVRVGGQLMLGLPGDTRHSLMRSVARLIALRPDYVRLYPTLVVAGSPLADLSAAGRYHPLSLSHAVALSSLVKKRFDSAAIPVIRMGLQPTESLDRSVISGPYHPAFGELVQSRIFLHRIRTLLRRRDGALPVMVTVSSRDQSILRGQGNCNIKNLQALGLLEGVTIRFSPLQARNSIELHQEEMAAS